MKKEDYILISSMNRNRLLYPSFSNFEVPFNHLSGQNFSNAINPVSSHYPIYNFYFPSENYITSKLDTFIISIEDRKLILDSNLMYRFQSNIEYLYDILKGWSIEVTISDAVFSRKIIKNNPINNEIEIDFPFPFIIDKNDSMIPAFIRNKSSPTSIICNGNFLDVFPTEKNLVLYNLTLNEFRMCKINKESQSLILTNPFSKFSFNDKYHVMNTESCPMFYGSIEEQINNVFFSLQFDRIKILNINDTMKYLSKNDIIYFQEENKPFVVTENYYHLYRVKDISSEINSSSFEVIRFGSQSLELKQYKIKKINELLNIIHLPNVQITSLDVCFKIKLKNSDIDSVKSNNYLFFPLILSNQYKFESSSSSSNELKEQPNNSISSYLNSTSNSLMSSLESSGVFIIKKKVNIKNENDETESFIYVNRTVNREIIDRLNLLSSVGSLNKSFILCRFDEDSFQGINGFRTSFEKPETKIIKIKNLILPNITVKNTTKKLHNFPYLILDIDSITKPTNYNNYKIISNNPNASNKKFIIPLKNEYSYKHRKYIRIDCDSLFENNFHFLPYDNLVFKFCLPNGSLLEASEEDYNLPLSPNDNLDITIFISVHEI